MAKKKRTPTQDVELYSEVVEKAEEVCNLLALDAAENISNLALRATRSILNCALAILKEEVK